LGIQRELEKKWKTPYFNQKLTSIKFNKVGLRGVKNSTINFNYPNEFVSFSDHHGLFRVIGEEISRMRVVDGMVRFYFDEFRGVIKFVEGS